MNPIARSAARRPPVPCAIAHLAATLALAATPLAAQSPLVTTFAHDNGNAPGGSIYFDLTVHDPAGVTLTALDLNTPTAAGTIDLYSFAGGYAAAAATPAAWTLRAQGQFVGHGSGSATPVCLSSPVFLAAGTHGIALSGPGVEHDYTVGAVGMPLSYATAELTLTAGAAANLTFGGVQYAPRIWNGRLHYETGNAPGRTCASSSALGSGCVDGAVSFYERFIGLSAVDLAGTAGQPVTVRATAAGSLGYVVLTTSDPWIAPGGPRLNHNRSPAAPLGDDDVSEPLQLPFAFPFPDGSTTVVHATSNGYLLLGPSTATHADLLPTVDELLHEGPRLCPLWCDLHASANATSGVHFDVLPGGQAVLVTWHDVGDGRAGTPAPGTTSVDVQCELHQNGDFVFRYAGIAPAGNGFGQVIAGWSPGGGARDPGPADLSAGTTTSGPDSHPLVHDAGLARLGSDIDLAVAAAEPVLPFAVLLAGDTLPGAGVELGPLGAPGCSLYVSGLATALVPIAFPGGGGSLSLAVPNHAPLIGSAFASQFAALSAKNPLGLVTSNAMRWSIGL